jgi:hypothetical protein
MQGKKADDVEIVVSDKIDSGLLGVFENSFRLSNYEYSLKSEIKDEEDSKENDEVPNEDKDERTKKHKKTIGKYIITREDESFKEN